MILDYFRRGALGTSCEDTGVPLRTQFSNIISQGTQMTKITENTYFVYLSKFGTLWVN